MAKLLVLIDVLFPHPSYQSRPKCQKTRNIIRHRTSLVQNRSSERLLHRAMLARLENLEFLEKMVKKDLLVPKDTLDLQEHKECLVDLEVMG